MAGSVLWRYAAIGAQFFIVTGVTHYSPIAIAGRYFGIYGFVSVAFTIVGFGVPDGAVRRIPKLRLTDDRRVMRTVNTTVSFSVLATLLIVPIMVPSLHILFGLSQEVGWLSAAWWVGYCIVFLCGQLITALDKPVTGTFVAYSLINFACLPTQLMYVAITPRVDLTGLLLSGVAGTAIAVVLSIWTLERTCWHLLKQHALSWHWQRRHRHELASLLKGGFPMMVSRFLQAAIPWIPTWTLLIVGESAAAAKYGAASRLAVAATSLIAAIRFTVRPRLVTLYETKHYDEISTLSRRLSVICMIPPILAACVLEISGRSLITTIFGPSYATSALIVEVLMLAVAAEAIGGVSDEILKMSGRTRIVLISMAIGMFIEIVAAVSLRHAGPVAEALAVVLAFGIEYCIQVVWLSRRTPIVIYPLLAGPKASV
jgi:O-antigen/teichoic acid export membrane protein